MEVAVVRLRRKGVKLPADAVKGAAPICGDLQLFTRAGRIKEPADVPVAMLIDPVCVKHRIRQQLQLNCQSFQCGLARESQAHDLRRH